MGFPRAAEHLRPFGRRRSGLRRCPGAGIALQDPGEEGGPQPDPCPDPRCGFGSGVGSLRERPPCDAARDAAEQSTGAAPVPLEQPGGCSGITSASPGRCTAETPSSFPRCSALSCPIAPHPKPPPAALAPAKGPAAEHSLTHGALRRPRPRNTLQVLRLRGGKRQPAHPNPTPLAFWGTFPPSRGGPCQGTRQEHGRANPLQQSSHGPFASPDLGRAAVQIQITGPRSTIPSALEFKADKV